MPLWPSHSPRARPVGHLSLHGWFVSSPYATSSSADGLRVLPPRFIPVPKLVRALGICLSMPVPVRRSASPCPKHQGKDLVREGVAPLMQASEFSTKKAPGRIWPPSLFPRETQRAAHSCLSWWMGRVKTFVCSVLPLPAYPGEGDHPRLGDHTLIENARRDRPSCSILTLSMARQL